MNVVLRKTMTLEQFLAWEERQELRHEFDGVQSAVAAMVFSRQGAFWVTDLLAGGDAVLQLPEIGIEIPLAELYTDVLPT